MIFRNEFKRILHPMILAFIVVVSVLWYLTFMGTCNDYLSINDGMPYAVAREYVHRFGTTIDFDEIKEIKQDQETARAELNALIAQYMGEYGIHTIDEYDTYSEKYYDTFRDQKSEDYSNAVSEWGEDEYNRRLELYDTVENIYWDHDLPVNSAAMKTQSIEAYIEEYDGLLKEREGYAKKSDDWFFYDATRLEKQILEKRLSKDEISVAVGFFALKDNFDSYSVSWSLLIYLCCTIMMIPVLLKNRMNGVMALQYSSKQGRRILRKQLLAALSAGLLISLLLILVFQVFYFQDGIADFINCPLNLSTGDGLYWFDFTFLTYMLCLWAKTLLLVICEILILFWVSYYGRNYVTAIAASVPIIVLLHLLCKRTNWYLELFLGYPRFLYPLAIGVTVVLSFAVSLFLMCRAKKADYME